MFLVAEPRGAAALPWKVFFGGCVFTGDTAGAPLVRQGSCPDVAGTLDLSDRKITVVPVNVFQGMANMTLVPLRVFECLFIFLYAPIFIYCPLFVVRSRNFLPVFVMCHAACLMNDSCPNSPSFLPLHPEKFTSIIEVKFENVFWEFLC
jgi:hypothetical protein